MIDRRRWLSTTGGGLAALCLRSLATGLPVAWLADPRRALAQAGAAPQTLILCTSQAGDPFNAHAPGCPTGLPPHPDARLRHTQVEFGEARVEAAAPWGQLPRALRDRMAFVVHATSVNAHPEHAKVMRLNGAAKGPGGNGEDMLVSSIAARTAGALGTIQREPVNLGRTSMTFQGRVLPRARPTDLQDLFVGNEGALQNLAPVRDRTLDALAADLRANGTRAQQAFLEQYAVSRTQARQLGQNLGALLEGIPADPDAPDSAADQVKAAAALASLRVAPAMILTLPFGGDNHADPELAREAEETLEGLAAIGLLWAELGRYGLIDAVTVVQWNVFGRTLGTDGDTGRDHNGKAHTTMMFGPRVRAGVVGGMARDDRDWAARPFDARTGRPVDRGGVAIEDGLASVGRTLCTAVGLAAPDIDAAVSGGQVIAAALKA